MMRRSYKYKAKVSNKVLEKIKEVTFLHRFLYNCMLEQKIKAYSMTKKLDKDGKWKGVYLTGYDQKAMIPEIKELFPEYKSYPSNIWQEVPLRLDKAYKAFFKGGGFPKFKSARDVQTFKMTYVNGYSMDNLRSKIIHDEGILPKKGYINISGIGPMKLLGYNKRPIDGRIKEVSVSLDRDKVYIIFCCDNVSPDYRELSGEVGIDLGVKAIVSDSDGNQVLPPDFMKDSQNKLRIAQRKLSRMKKYSKNWFKQVETIQDIYKKLRNQKTDFIHKLTKSYMANYNVVVVEDLKTRNLTKSSKGTIESPGKNVAQKSGLNREILMRNFYEIVQTMEHKAEKFGSTLVKVSPHNTSQDCSSCGIKVKKSLSIRIHSCTNCGAVLDRDINAALNILKKYKEGGSVGTLCA